MVLLTKAVLWKNTQKESFYDPTTGFYLEVMIWCAFVCVCFQLIYQHLFSSLCVCSSVTVCVLSGLWC